MLCRVYADEVSVLLCQPNLNVLEALGGTVQLCIAMATRSGSTEEYSRELIRSGGILTMSYGARVRSQKPEQIKMTSRRRHVDSQAIISGHSWASQSCPRKRLAPR